MRFGRLIIQHIFWRGLYFVSLFLLNVIIARYFGADGSGWIYYVINNLSFLLLVASLSLESGAAYYSASGEMDPGKTGITCLVWTVPATGLCLLFIIWITAFHQPGFIGRIEWMIDCAAYIWGILLTTYFSSLFFAKQDFFTPNFILFLVSALIIGAIFVWGKADFFRLHFVSVYFFSFLLQGLLLALVFLLKNSFRGKKPFLSIPEFRKVIRYSLLALLANIVFFLVYRVDYWFVRKFCSEHDLGNYIQVSKLGQLFLIIPNIISAILFPRIAGNGAGQAATVKVLIRNLFVFTLLAILFLVIAGRQLFPLVFGRTFDSMYYPFLLLAPGILSLVLLVIFSAYFAGKNKVRINVLGCCMALPVIVLLDFLFIPKYGIHAAAASSSIGYAVTLSFSFIQYRKSGSGEDRLIEYLLPPKADYRLWKDILKNRHRGSGK